MCNEHFVKEDTKKQKICDFCDRKSAKIDVRVEIEKELDILSQELERTKQNCDRIDRVYYEKISEINKLGQQLAKIIDYHDGKKQLLQARLENEKERAEKYANLLKKSIFDSEDDILAQQEMEQKYKAVEIELEKSNAELNLVRKNNVKLTAEIQEKARENENKVYYDEIKNKICIKCDLKLEHLISTNSN